MNLTSDRVRARSYPGSRRRQAKPGVAPIGLEHARDRLGWLSRRALLARETYAVNAQMNAGEAHENQPGILPVDRWCGPAPGRSELARDWRGASMNLTSDRVRARSYVRNRRRQAKLGVAPVGLEHARDWRGASTNLASDRVRARSYIGAIAVRQNLVSCLSGVSLLAINLAGYRNEPYSRVRFTP